MTCTKDELTCKSFNFNRPRCIEKPCLGAPPAVAHAVATEQRFILIETVHKLLPWTTFFQTVGCGSKPFWYHFGVGAPSILVHFCGDWDVHWGYDLGFDPWPAWARRVEPCVLVEVDTDDGVAKECRFLAYNRLSAKR